MRSLNIITNTLTGLALIASAATATNVGGAESGDARRDSIDRLSPSNDRRTPPRSSDESHANSFIPGDDLVGRFNWLNEIQEATFEAFPGLKFRVKLKAMTPGQAARVSILHEGREEVASWTIAGDSMGKTYKKKLHQGGEYVLRIENVGQVAGSYVLYTKRKLSPGMKAGTLKLKSNGDRRPEGFTVKALAGATVDIVAKAKGTFDPSSSVLLVGPSGATTALGQPLRQLGDGEVALDGITLDEAGEYQVLFEGLAEAGAKLKVKFQVDQPSGGHLIDMVGSVLPPDGREEMERREREREREREPDHDRRPIDVDDR